VRVTFVKKVLENGSPCRKCAEVETRLAAEGLLDRVDEVVIADERDPSSAGMRLAERHGVDRAPFFVVTDDSGETRVYTVFLKFLKDVLRRGAEETLELTELVEDDADFDYL
jgi:hypothetical protein